MKNLTNITLKNNDISLSNAISKRILTVDGWEDMNEDIQFELLEKFKEFMLTTCRPNCKPYKKIEYTNFSNLEDVGLYRRLVYNVDRKKVQYVAGQNYPEEIARLKKFIMKTQS